jgi:aspartate/methionine/tyrosine aminotransferase
VPAAPAPLTLASTARSLPPSPTLAINEAIAMRRAAGQDVLHLGFGEASFPLPPALAGALAGAAGATGYAPVLGIAALRAAIAAYLTRTRGFAVSADQVAVAPGSKPLLYALMQVLDGDVLVPAPSWVSYAPQARLAGRQVVPVATDTADHHTLTPEALQAAAARARHAGANPRILVVNSPSNPTGSMFARAAVEALAAWARREGVTILSDEIYAELAHGWRPHTSPAVFYPEGTIVTGGLSKAFSAGGWRLGYAALPEGAAGKNLLSALRALASEIWSAASGPIQEAAVVAYTPGEELETYVRRSARLHGAVTGSLHRALVAAGVECERPAGAFYLYPDFAPWRGALAAQDIASSMELARHLLDNWGIATLPGMAFGDAPEALRLRLATSLLYGNDTVPADERDAALWALLERADELPAPEAEGAADLALPLLARAEVRLAEFVAALGAPDQGLSK